MSYGVGDQVLCVKTGWGSFPNGHPTHCPNIPHRGRLYVVRALEEGGTEPWVLLRELVNPTFNNRSGVNQEPVFLYHQFVPVKRTKTDISALRALLEPTGAHLAVVLDDAIREAIEETLP